MTKPDNTFPISIDVQVTAEQIERTLSVGELIQFIKELDAAAGIWDVTLPLCEHFAALALEHKLEEAADAARKRGA